MKYDIIFSIATDAIDAKAMTGKTFAADDTVCVIINNNDKTYVGFSDTDLREGRLVTGCSEKEAAKNMLSDNSSEITAMVTLNCISRIPVLPCAECVSMILEMNPKNTETLIITPAKTYIKITDTDRFVPGKDNSALESDAAIGETDPLVIATPMNGNGLVSSKQFQFSSDKTVLLSDTQDKSPENFLQSAQNTMYYSSNYMQSGQIPQYFGSQYMNSGQIPQYINPHYQQPSQQYVQQPYYQQQYVPQYTQSQFIQSQYIQPSDNGSVYINSQFSNQNYMQGNFSQPNQNAYTNPGFYQVQTGQRFIPDTDSDSDDDDDDLIQGKLNRLLGNEK